MVVSSSGSGRTGFVHARKRRRGAAGGDFDISDVALLKPDPGATVSLPVTFSWERRGIPGDTYRVIIFDLDSGRSWTTADLGDTDSFTSSNLHPAIQFGKAYGWYMEVYNGPDSYGESFDFREVTFSGSNQQSPAQNSAFSLQRSQRP